MNRMVLRTRFVLAVSFLLALGTVPAPGKALDEQLIEAARDGHLDAVEALIREGAKVDA